MVSARLKAIQKDLGGVEICAVGKAALPMAKAAEDLLGDRVKRGLAITPYEGTFGLKRIEMIRTDHPFPGERSIEAAKMVEAFFKNAAHPLLFLLSGGASAALTSPVAGISGKEMREVTRVLVGSGLSISEINTVRRHLDKYKGGKLSVHCRQKIWTMAISDVIGNSPWDIGSGPTAFDPTTFADAYNLLEEHGLVSDLPIGVMSYLAKGRDGALQENPICLRKGDQFEVLFDNSMALDAARVCAESTGYRGIVLTRSLMGGAAKRGRQLAAIALAVETKGEPICLLSGGETHVNVQGTGRGGRNQELCLAAAIEIEGNEGILISSLGTDGIDGPTDAAGAIVDGKTIKRIQERGMDPIESLAANNSYGALDLSDDLIRTGPTFTNVMDLQSVLITS